MSPWYWAPIGLAVLGIGLQVYETWWFDDFSWPGALLLLVAAVWAVGLGISHEPASWSSPAPATTRVCTAQALEPVYNEPLKHAVPTWVCVGWSEQ